MVAIILSAVAAISALIAWTVFTGCFFSSVDDSPVDFKPDYALILVAIAMLMLIGSTITLVLFYPESATAK